jgi:hypothetical protein
MGKMNAHATVQFVAAVMLAVAAASVAPNSLAAQATIDLTGVVLDVDSREGIPDVILRVLGTDVSAASDEDGRFTIRGVPAGEWILRVDHLAYGTHQHSVTVAEGVSLELEVRLAQQAIELAPIVVEGETTLERERRTTGASFWEVDRMEIQRALGTSRHMGDLIRQTIPGLHLRQSAQLSGVDVCLEFRSAATISIVNNRACNHPMVLVDGVRVSDPNYLYGTIGMSNLERIQVIPPGSAGARYGTGALYGVILIETARPGLVREPGDNRPSSMPPPEKITFDWAQDPAGHNTTWSMVGAILGNTIGLAGGLWIARQCVQIVDEEIDSTCGTGTNIAAGSAAFILPAAGSAFGARLGGGTALSVGRTWPAVFGASMMLFPGYAFSLTTAGGDQNLVNKIGNTFLIVGVPLAVTAADRLFRKLR